ncbi:LEA type 2 family protein [Halorubrum distributum]|uniref:Water stress and Hypersensitive response domain protein n=1 Tax=Halorubrum distributum JCM 13916 TaxID=1230455 RepID=M0PLN1_9EURY|nr:LEA type 2 family protein [Halorubrum arcis]EMA70937.1 Water stress and Hypersensitive response domain protein [Halorubrum arcis JCM 13916]
MALNRIVSALTAGKLRIAVVGLLVVAAAVGGAFALGVVGVPSVAAVNNSFGDVTNETTVVETDLVVSNPNPIGVGLDGVSIDYTVSMNDVEMASGGREGVSVASGNSSIAFETDLENDAIPPWWTSHVENDERTTVAIDATVTSDLLGRSANLTRTRQVETDLIGAFTSDETRPVNADAPLVDDPVLYVNETRGRWGTVSEEETPIEMEFDAYNPNLEPYVVTEIGYDVTMNGVAMGSGSTEEEYVIPSYGSETVELSAALRNERLDEWWVTHLDESVNGHQVSDLRIEFYAVVELPSGEELTVQLDALTYEETIETDIFDEGLDRGKGSDTGNSADSDGGDNTSDDGTSDDGGNTSDGGTSDDGGNTTDDDSGDDDDGLLPLVVGR